MRTRTRFLLLSTLFAASVGSIFYLAPATPTARAASNDSASSAPEIASCCTDTPIAGYRTDLLELAFQAASAMPLEPHIKNRSRAQESVVAACLELDQRHRALAYIEKIANWRRGAAYADYAFHCAEKGDGSQVEHYLELARGIADAEQGANVQDWPRDRIRAKIARAYALLGQSERATNIDASLAPAESGKVAAVHASVADADSFDQQLDALAPVLASAEFEQARSGLEACAQLFDRNYSDLDRRGRAEQAIASGWSKMPATVRIEITIELAQSAIDHDDASKARTLLGDARDTLAAATWLPEAEIPLRARLAAKRFDAGERDDARRELDSALAMFDSKRAEIVDIYRAGVLRVLAEACAQLGDAEKALAVYARAVEAGVENPNSRPRAEDFAATCCAMACRGVEPNADLLARLHAIADGLGDPW